MGKLYKALRGTLADRCGASAVTFAMVLPVLLLVVGGALDLGQALTQRGRLQAAIDKAALAAARELGLSDARRENVPEVVRAMVLTALAANGSAGALATLETVVRDDPLEVEVTARQATRPVFGSLGIGAIDLDVTAVARIVGRPNVCVLALDPKEPMAIWLVRSARLTGNGCSVFSNSTSSSSIVVRDNAQLAAQVVCSAGGVVAAGSISPAPLADCPTFDDPLASRAEPSVAVCDFKDVKIDSKTVTLQPGVYCGGLTIQGTAEVTLAPGVYSIKGKPLMLSGSARLVGDGVTFYLDSTAWLFFGPESSVKLKASKSGPLAGLLFFGSRQQSTLLTHTILSRSAQELVGTVYLPRNSLVIDGDAGVGGESAYTAIVARRLVLLNGPHLVLNANYDLTDVPVPHGIRGASQPVSLVK
ncbi:MAG: pilus assembly protein TadG-related protein [Hyphomicrobiaceae bacterium]